jgi:hypothetical protein
VYALCAGAREMMLYTIVITSTIRRVNDVIFMMVDFICTIFLQKYNKFCIFQNKAVSLHPKFDDFGLKATYKEV